MAFSTAINSVILTASLTLKAKDGSGTKTLAISSDHVETFQGSTFVEHYPILKTVRGLSQEHDQFMPLSTSAQMILDNSEGSLGFQRRFVDLLDTHTITEQDCSVTINLKSNSGTSAKFQETLSYKMQNVEGFLDGGELVLNLKNNPISEKIITKELTVEDFPSIYTSSVGRHLPLVFGEDAKVLCEKLGAAEYGFATNFGSDYKCSDPSQYFIRARNGEYQEINFAATTSTAIDYNAIGTSLGSYTNLGASASDFTPEITGGAEGMELQDFTDNETGYIIDRGRVYLKTDDDGAASIGGELIFQIAVGEFNRAESIIKDFSILASAVVDKADLSTEYNAGTTQWIDFTFEEPAIIGKDQNEQLTYWLLVTDNSCQEGLTSFLDYNLSSGTIRRLGYFINEGTSRNWRQRSDTSYTPRFELYGATTTDSSSTTTDDNGLAYHSFTINTGTSDNNLSKYQFGVVVDGLGTTSSPDTDAPTIIKNLLDQTDNDYVDAGFDDDWAESQTNYPREISGALLGRTQLTSALRELCRNGACRILNVAGFSSSNGLDIQSWGAEVDTLHDLYDTDFKTNSFKVSNRELVVNNMSSSYRRNPLTTDADELLRQGVASGFTVSMSNRVISEDSVSIYGRNDLADGNFPLIEASQTMQSVADFFLRSFDNPPAYVEISFPYIPRKLIAGRVVELLTPKLPAYNGTSAKPLKAVDDNIQVVEVEDGIDQVRAKRYRGLIEGRRITMNKEGQVLINLRIRLLESSFDPT